MPMVTIFDPSASRSSNYEQRVRLCVLTETKEDEDRENGFVFFLARGFVFFALETRGMSTVVRSNSSSRSD